VTVTQGAQTRIFQTDWLGRPVSVTEPESGTTTYSYAYNPTGLQVTQIRPQANQTNPNVTTTTWTQYDALGRLGSISYSDGTPGKSDAYDVAQQWGTTLTNPKGRLVAESTSSTTGAIYGYDSMGRVTLRDECTPSTCGSSSFQTSYNYDEAGNLLWSTDGFNIKNSYTYSQANEVQFITSTLNDPNDHPNIVSYVQNGPSGPLSWQLGNGLCAARQYDAMGRITGGSVRQGASLPSCTGGTQVYGFTASWAWPYISSSCDGVPYTCSNYQHDEFGRLSTANIYQGSGASFSYVYDRWGNRTAQNVTAGSGPQPQFSFNTGNNRITNGGYAYDAAGNLGADGSGSTYQYDAEGNLTRVINGGQTISQSTYDAENQRVRTDNNGTVAYEFIFNPSGQRASVYYATGGYQIQGQTYWGSAPVEFYNNGYAHYQHQNWLGTERAATNNSGQVEGTYSSLAFGDGFSVSGTDDDPYHFAGMDYDSNSGYNGTAHAQFRQYANDAGRWMSPDPYGGSYDVTNPQSLNRYAYVGNNPLSMTDVSGLMECDSNSCFGEGGGGGINWGGGDGGICFLFWCWYPGGGGGGGNGEGGGGGSTPAPQPQFKGYEDLDPNRTMNDHLGLPAGMRLPTGGILDIFGIGVPGCEFGACGPVGMGATPGNIWVAGGGGPITLSPWIFFILGLAHAPSNAPNNSSGKYPTRMFDTHWCGPGGAGPTVNQLDIACKAHDKCYDRGGFAPWSNFSLLQDPGLQACNQDLCDAARQSTDLGATRVRLYFSLIPKDYCH
jgi:RHS repeat-associated protein